MRRNINIFTLLFIVLLNYLSAQNDFFRVGFWGIFPAPDTSFVSPNEKILLENSNANVIQAWLLANDRHIDKILKQLIGRGRYQWPVRQIENIWFNYLDSLNKANPANAVYHIVGYNTDEPLLGNEKQFYYYGKVANQIKTNRTYQKNFFECLKFYTDSTLGGFALRLGFGGYYIDHEKAILKSDEYLKGLRFIGHHIKLKDKQHPVICSGNINFINPHLPIILNDSIDVLESQFYPFKQKVTYNSFQYDYQHFTIKSIIEKHWEPTSELLRDSHIDWWAIIQACKFEWKPSRQMKRYPTGPELFLQAYLAVSRGARGVLAFIYGDHKDPHNNGTFKAGLNLWKDETEPRTVKIIKDAVSGREYSIYDTLKVLFAELKTYGPYLMKLEPEFAFLATGEYGTIPTKCFIKFISGKYIEAATFKKYNNEDYFMVINRICNIGHLGEIGIPAPPQNITIFFHHLKANQCYKIYDILKKQSSVICTDADGTLQFTYSLKPGRGRLFKLSANTNN